MSCTCRSLLGITFFPQNPWILAHPLSQGTHPRRRFPPSYIRRPRYLRPYGRLWLLFLPCHRFSVNHLPPEICLPVREIVLSGCQGRCGSRPFYNKEEKQLAEENLRKMQIDKLSKRCYRELSGGQQQRVLLARALCATQKMLLLDEPVSGLDPKVTAEMYRLIDELNHRDGITIIMISHDIAAAVKYASHILHIGNTVFFGTKAEYLQSPQGRLFAAEKGGDEQ